MRSMVEGPPRSGGYIAFPSTTRLRRAVPLPRQAWGGMGSRISQQGIPFPDQPGEVPRRRADRRHRPLQTRN